MPPSWNRGRLQALIRQGLGDLPLILASNRQPWIHSSRNGSVVAERPASGMVTALEPLAEASGGTWIAHAVARPIAAASMPATGWRYLPTSPVIGCGLSG
jgi:trehalose-6-phosphate synthase